MGSLVSCKNTRRFGGEVELNTANGVIAKLDEDVQDIPNGADKVALLINQTVREKVSIHGWQHTHNNETWVVKPDSSCGIEVCSPVLKGWNKLSNLMRVTKCFRDAKWLADSRCSFHVHANIGDLSPEQLTSVVAWYIKCEPVLLDSVPSYRKMNRYCQVIGMTDLFKPDTPMRSDVLFYKLSQYKYYTMNMFHFMRGGGFECDDLESSRQTVEFRTAEHAACVDPFFVKNWVRFLLHFVDTVKDHKLPKRYTAGDSWSGLSWLNPVDVFRVLKLDKKLSPGMQQVRSWFVNRALANGYNNALPGVWSNEGRSVSRAQFLELSKVYQTTEKTGESEEDLLFSEKYIT